MHGSFFFFGLFVYLFIQENIFVDYGTEFGMHTFLCSGTKKSGLQF